MVIHFIHCNDSALRGFATVLGPLFDYIIAILRLFLHRPSLKLAMGRDICKNRLTDLPEGLLAGPMAQPLFPLMAA
jgi:hypothetical protein